MVSRPDAYVSPGPVARRYFAQHSPPFGYVLPLAVTGSSTACFPLSLAQRLLAALHSRLAVSFYGVVLVAALV